MTRNCSNIYTIFQAPTQGKPEILFNKAVIQNKEDVEINIHSDFQKIFTIFAASGIVAKLDAILGAQAKMLEVYRAYSESFFAQRDNEVRLLRNNYFEVPSMVIIIPGSITKGSGDTIQKYGGAASPKPH